MQRRPVEQSVRLPFDQDFQRSLVKLLCEDETLCHAVGEYLEPRYFEDEVLSWVILQCREHQKQYGRYPRLKTIKQLLNPLDSRLRGLYGAVIDQIEQAELHDVSWMRDQTLDFVRRNLFVTSYHESRHLYNAGQVDQAYELLMESLEKIRATSWADPDRCFFFEGYPSRHDKRMSGDAWQEAITTGIDPLDKVLDGGLSLGELGIWVAYPKCGKTTLLTNLGVAATKIANKRVLHFVFEGSRIQSENRYDAAFMNEFYARVKHGEVDSETYTRTWREFQTMFGQLVIRGFTDRWDYTILDIHGEIRDLWRMKGWKPDLVVVDYGDLIGGREKVYSNETEKQKAAFRDLKGLANRGYAIWTASQARRPEKGAEDRPHWIYSREIADCFEKVRVADFIGSINVTNLEREHKVARILAELYRDNEAHQKMVVKCEFDRMRISHEGGLQSPAMPDLEATPRLGYQSNGQPAVVGPQQQRGW